MNLVKKIYLKKTIKKYEKKIKSLGSNSKINIENFLLSRTFIDLALFILLVFIPKFGIILAILVTLLFHILYPYLLIDSNLEERHDALYEEGLMLFQMLKLSLISTNDLRKSLEIVANKLDNSLANDFKKSLARNAYNNNLLLIFKDMEERIPNQDIIVSLIDLSESSDYIKTLDNIISNLQIKNKELIRRKCSALPFKLTIISLTFIVSIILLIVYLPSILSTLG